MANNFGWIIRLCTSLAPLALDLLSGSASEGYVEHIFSSVECLQLEDKID